MADDGEKKASSLLSEEQDGGDENDNNVEAEFQVADYNDEIRPGWRLATVEDVENNMEQVQSEICGMSFNYFSLVDGTVGGPGYGYKISHETGKNLEHKLLISGTSTSSPEVLPDNHIENDAITTIDNTSQNGLNTDVIDASSVTPESALVIDNTSLDILNTDRIDASGVTSESTLVTMETTLQVSEQSNNVTTTLLVSEEFTINTTETTLQVSEQSNNDCSNILLVSEESAATTVLTPNEGISAVMPSEGISPVTPNEGISAVTQNESFSADINIDQNESLTIQTVSVEAPDHSPQIDMIISGSKEVNISDDDKPADVRTIDSRVSTSSEDSPPVNAKPNMGEPEEKPGDKSSESSPSVRKKKAKPMSASMQRLTAKKGESPESKRSTDFMSASDRKAKADELRKKKISEQRNKDDERRAAVLERKKKMEDADREKKEALFKKLTSTDNEKSPVKANNINKRYSLSTSNLSQLKKTKRIECKVDLNATTAPKRTENKQKDTRFTGRPQSALPGRKIKTTATTKKSPDLERPMTAEPRSFQSKSTTSKTSAAAAKPSTTKPPVAKSSTKTFTKPPISKQSLNPRSASVMGVPSADKRNSLPSRQPRATTSERNPIKVNTSMTMRKAHSATGLLSKDKDVKKTDTKSPVKKGASTDVNKPDKMSPVKKGASTVAPEKKRDDVKKTSVTTEKKNGVSQANAKKELPNEAADKKKEKPKPLKTTTTATKEKKTGSLSDNKPNDVSPKKKSFTPAKKMSKSESKKDAKTEKAGQMTEEEAKKALAERRKKAKEEAEMKAKAEREKDEIERLKREEEERRLAEQLKLEEEKQAALMAQLKKEEDERRQKLMDEKEQREREERERLEAEQHQREEEIDRKAKLELDKIQKEQEKQELLLNKERIDRKKRVEMIMARVSQKRTTNLDDSQNGDAPSLLPVETTSPPELVDSARLKVDGILRSRGFGKSCEDLSNLTDRSVEIDIATDASEATDNISDETSNESESKSETDNEQLTTNGELSLPLIGTPVENGVQGNQLTISMENTPPSTDDVPIPLEESPPLVDKCPSSSTETPVLLDEAPSVELPGDDVQCKGNAAIIEDNLGTYEQLLDQNDTDFLISSDNSKNENETDINELPTETLQEIDLSMKEKSSEQLCNDNSINDTNNNKDYIIDNRPVAINAWDQNQVGNIVIESDQKQTLINKSAEKLQNLDMGPDNTCIEKCSKQVDNQPESIHMNGNQEGNENVNGDIHLINNSSVMVKCEENLTELEGDQWNKFEERMKQIQPTADQVPGNDENKLWKVLEGQVELSECF